MKLNYGATDTTGLTLTGNTSNSENQEELSLLKPPSDLPRMGLFPLTATMKLQRRYGRLLGSLRVNQRGSRL
ncbi:MAG: hypothetical protein H0U18_16560 [Pyrinomonadaceae bacterium]|nr:hypothetical protein [Pyrinomonadaceae bacterium]